MHNTIGTTWDVLLGGERVPNASYGRNWRNSMGFAGLIARNGLPVKTEGKNKEKDHNTNTQEEKGDLMI